MSETKMVKASLRKTIAYANELLMLLKKDEDIEAWIQTKISEIDHNIESVYSYYKFGDDDDSEEPEDEEDENEEDTESESDPLNFTEIVLELAPEDLPRP